MNFKIIHVANEGVLVMLAMQILLGKTLIYLQKQYLNNMVHQLLSCFKF